MFILALAALLLSAWYVPWRLRLWLGFKKTSWPWILPGLAAVAGLPALLMTGWYLADSAPVGAAYNALGLLFMLQAYLFLITAIVDAAFGVLRLAGVQGQPAPLGEAGAVPEAPSASADPAGAPGAEPGGQPAPNPGPKPAEVLRPGRLVTLIIMAMAVYMVVWGAFNASDLKITLTEIPVEGLAAPVSIVHAPDLHLGHQRGAAWLERTLASIAELKPDLVIYNGDMVDSHAALTPEVFDLFRSLGVPQYYTTGNHEYYVDTERTLDMARAAGLIVLRSEMVETLGLQLIGLEYMNADRAASDPHSVNRLTIEEELPKIARDPLRPVLLVHHSPVGLEYVQAAGDVDVMLSGHTHGGQVFPGTMLIRMRFPQFRGLYREGPTTLLVSQGAGTFGPFMRLGSFNEIQLVRLVPAQGG